MNTLLKTFFLGMLAAAAVLFSGAALALEWPVRPVKLVVPYPPGSGPDTLARALGERLGRALPQPVVVENRPGANGVIGTGAVVNAAPDGHTLLVVDRAALIANPLILGNVPYHWQADLRPVSNLASVDLFVVVNKNGKFGSFKSLVDYARANPQKLNFGSSGIGDVSHVALEQIARGEGVRFTHVPYLGLAPAITALMGGEIDALVSGPVPIRGPIKEGRLSAVAVGTGQRAAVLPEVPTIEEAGGGRYGLPSTVFVLMAPARTPDDVTARIHAEVRKVAADRAFVQQFETMGLVPSAATPEDTLKGILSIKSTYEGVIGAAGVKKE